MSGFAGWCTAVVAHQGGWDEILLIGVPILLIVGALWVAKRRVEASPPRAGGGPDPGETVVE